MITAPVYIIMVTSWKQNGGILKNPSPVDVIFGEGNRRLRLPHVAIYYYIPKNNLRKLAGTLPRETARKRTNLHIPYSCTICRFPKYMGRSESWQTEADT